MDEYLFHGLKPYACDHWYEREQEEANILKKILETGFIASRKYLKELLSEENDDEIAYNDFIKKYPLIILNY